MLFCFMSDASILSTEEMAHQVRSKGAVSSEPFGWEALGNKMTFRGVGRLAQKDISDIPATEGGATKPARRRKGDNARDANVGAALRSVYSQTVDEPIPDEFMDLLSKLD